MVVAHFAITIVCALLMLALFDSNLWLIVVLVAVVTSALNYWITKQVLDKLNWGQLSLGQGILGSVLAYLLSLTPFFRATFGTLIGYALLLGVGYYSLKYLPFDFLIERKD